MSAGLALTAVACGSDKPGTVAGDGSVTVTHAFGETKISSAPKRVVSAGSHRAGRPARARRRADRRHRLVRRRTVRRVAVGASRKLGAAQPVVLNLADGIQVDQIAALKPDLIVATNAGLDQDTYTKLSAIAPTIAQSGQNAFFEPWKDQANAIGQAVFKFDDMTKLVADVDAKFTEVGKNNAAFSGKKAVRGQRDGLRRTTTTSPRPGWRTEFLTQMGFAVPDEVERLREGRPGSGPARQAGLGARRRRRRDLDHRERRRAGGADRRPDVRDAEVDQDQPRTSSPARNSPARSPSRRCCPTRWWPTGYRR